ncbi:probable cleavage and polyadenylation specificity factor subunit 2 isoform X2 [Aethina tumida]|uniref:probable cleavage and polyadenylation specificity factor subunit 2 isoform X2 n=1 Tax=Aethina tumida TaxID=116153 RepID=UPI0021496638|nr:probable cleavage and polyadenylation specificity factor subunit 2 isoform X2 [Aethina tumida]
MTSIVKFTALSGARDESPPCYLLEVDEMTLLLDCGWDEKFNMDFIEEVKKHINVIDAVLISFPDVFHLGALPYLVGKCGLNCPIYATIPVYKMGQMFMYDLYQSHHNMKNFNVFSLDDVDATFEKIIQLKFNQSVSIKGKGFGVTITPLPAGHMIGGTIWKILKVGEEDVIYANDFNHKKERHLNGCELEKLQRPSLLITDGFNAGYQQARRRTRDEKLMTNILQTLRNNGNVLISVDTAGRVLELAHMLDQLWRNKESGLLSYSLALLNNVSYNVVEFAKSQIEWMSDKLMRNFEGARNNPFQFKHLQLCHSLHELSKVSSPKVVLASSPDMESGFSRELFLQWCSNPNNSVIITSRTSPGTLARDLVDNGGNRTIDLTVEKRVRLEGAELEEYQKKMKDFRQDNGDSDSDDDIEMSVISKGRHDIVIKEEGKVSGGFFKVTKKQYPMYPFKEDKIKYDEYGEIIRPEDYKLSDVVTDSEDNKENVVVKKEEEEIGLIPEVPTKCIVLQRTVQVNCQVQYIDFEGRSDGESLVKILSQLKPRRIILVRSPEENSKIIEKHCQDSVSGKIFTPEKGEAIDATSETHIYQVRLMDRLSHSLKFIKTKDGDIAWIDGQLIAREGTMDKQRMIVDDCFSDDDDDFDEFTLAPCSTEKTHDPVFINELKLSDFKMILAKNNINSEFSGGVLWCSNATIAIRRVENSKILLEGCVSEDYYRVRSLLYEQYAML